MKTIKNVLSGAIILALLAIILSSPQARADGMHGVRETATEILVEVPKFCRPLKTVWEVRWEQNADNEDAIFSFPQKENGQKIVLQYKRQGAFKFHALWRGGETIRIPKFDAKGKSIKIKFVSILALGEENGNLSKDNWLYESQNSRWVNGAIISSPVRVGTWGKCS